MNNLSLAELTRQHEEQKRLFEYQNSRVLVRPKTRIIDVIIWCLVYLFIIAICVLANIKISAELYYEIPISLIIYWLISEFSLKFIGVKIVQCYQHYAKEETRRRCLCIPSCSEYSIICFKKFEFIRACIKIKRRLTVTCKGKVYRIDPP